MFQILAKRNARHINLQKHMGPPNQTIHLQLYFLISATFCELQSTQQAEQAIVSLNICLVPFLKIPLYKHCQIFMQFPDAIGKYCSYKVFTTAFSLNRYRPTGSVRTGWAPGTVPPTTAKRAVSMENVSRERRSVPSI